VETLALRSPFTVEGSGLAQTTNLETEIGDAIRFIMGTRKRAPRGGAGECPWNANFGSLLHVLKHRAPDSPATAELARVYVVEPLEHWLPGVRVNVELETVKIGKRRAKKVLVHWRLTSRVTGSNVNGTVPFEVEE